LLSKFCCSSTHFVRRAQEQKVDSHVFLGRERKAKDGSRLFNAYKVHVSSAIIPRMSRVVEGTYLSEGEVVVAVGYDNKKPVVWIFNQNKK